MLFSSQMVSNSACHNRKTKRMKNGVPISKEEIKEKLLDTIASKAKIEWHGQKCHKLATAIWWLDRMGVKEQAKRNEMLADWAETPSSFGTNCSALGQALGREANAKTTAVFAGF